MGFPIQAKRGGRTKTWTTATLVGYAHWQLVRGAGAVTVRQRAGWRQRHLARWPDRHAGDACLPGICELQYHRAPICETLSALHLPSSITRQRGRIAELESPGGEAKAQRQVDRFLNELI